uniref:Large envelope protein n=1 Tax=Hepatitis B virus TaxID=10407 RepID=A0A8F3CIP6_HBV|nr:MAG: S protein [Hepatitis B virus]
MMSPPSIHLGRSPISRGYIYKKTLSERFLIEGGNTSTQSDSGQTRLDTSPRDKESQISTPNIPQAIPERFPTTCRNYMTTGSYTEGNLGMYFLLMIILTAGSWTTYYPATASHARVTRASESSHRAEGAMRFFARVWGWFGGNPSQTVTDAEHRARMQDPHAYAQYLKSLPLLNQAALISVSRHFNKDAHESFLQLLDNATYFKMADHYFRFREAYANHSITWDQEMEEEYWLDHALYPERRAPVGATIQTTPTQRPPTLPRPRQPSRNRTRPKKPSAAIPVLLTDPTAASRVIAILPDQQLPEGPPLLPPQVPLHHTPVAMAEDISPALLFPVVALVVYFLLTKAREILAKLDLWWTSHSFQGANGECAFQDTSPQTPKHLAGYCPLTCGGFLWTSLRLFIICLIILLAVCGYLFLMDKGFTSFVGPLWGLVSAPGTLLSSLRSLLKESGSIFLSIALLTWMISSYLTLTPTTSMLLLTGLWATYNNTGSA